MTLVESAQRNCRRAARISPSVFAKESKGTGETLKKGIAVEGEIAKHSNVAAP